MRMKRIGMVAAGWTGIVLGAVGPVSGQFCPDHPGNPVLLTAGTASCAHDVPTGNTTITMSDATIIQWDQLNVRGGSVLDFNFLAPVVNRTVVNRIIGTGANVIDGSVVSNGRVVVLSPGARLSLNGFVQVGDFLASTLDADNLGDLLDGQTVSFGGSGESARLSVNGVVEATDGDVVLAGRTVNIGGGAVVMAPAGAVRTMGATQFTLANTGVERLTGGATGKGSTVNTGRVEGAMVEMKAAEEISNAGLIEGGGGGGRVFLRVGPGGKVINEGTGQINGLLEVTGTFDTMGVVLDPDEGDAATAVRSAVSRFPGVRRPGEKRGQETVVVDTGGVSASVRGGRARNGRNGAAVASTRSGLARKSSFFGLRGGTSRKKRSR
jgi:filamentous hemagglutinin family protein